MHTLITDIVDIQGSCIGMEHWSSVQNIIVHSRKNWRTFLRWCAGDSESLTLEVPLISDVDLVRRQTAFHNWGPRLLISLSMFVHHIQKVLGHPWLSKTQFA